jgi:hypothetical protein
MSLVLSVQTVSNANNEPHNEIERCSQNTTHMAPGKKAPSLLVVEIPQEPAERKISGYK